MKYISISLLAIALPASAAYTLVNGDFEDATGSPTAVPTDWNATASVFQNGGFASGSTADAQLPAGNSIYQDFSGGPTVNTSENYDFQLDFARLKRRTPHRYIPQSIEAAGRRQPQTKPLEHSVVQA